MASPYIGPLDMDSILEGACAVTSWPSHHSWPKIVQYLRKIRIDDKYIEENKGYILETLNRYSFHSGGSVTDAGTDSTSLQSPLPLSQQWPPTPPESDRISSRYRTIDGGRLGSSSPHSNGQRSSQPKPFAEINKTEVSRSLSYGKSFLRSVPASKSDGDSLKMRPAKIWSFKRSDWHPATTTEGLTSRNFVRREIAEVAELEIEELEKSDEAISGQHEFFPPEGIVVIAVQPEGCIQTLLEEFLVTSHKDAPDLTIGQDLSVKIERFRDMIRSYQAIKDHHRYEGGFGSVLSDSNSRQLLNSRLLTSGSALVDEEPPMRYLQSALSLRSSNFGQQGLEIQERVPGFDEKTPLIARRLPISPDLRKPSEPNQHHLSSAVSRATTVDAAARVNQTGAVLPVSTAPIASVPETQDCVTLKLTQLSLLAYGTGMIVTILVVSLLSSYLVQRWGASP